MIKKIIKWINRNWENGNIQGFFLFIIFIVMVTLTFRLSERISIYICNVELEDMTNFVKFFLTLLFSTMLLPRLLKKGDINNGSIQ